MDFDPKCFFEKPPRMKDDLKLYIRTMADRIVYKITQLCLFVNNDKIGTKQIKHIILLLCVDPITCYTRDGLSYSQGTLRSMSRILLKAIDRAQQYVENGDKYGNMDKKMVKCVQSILTDGQVKFGSSGVISITACVSEVCGLLLHATYKGMNYPKTLTLEGLKTYGTTHFSESSSKSVTNASLIRLLHVLEQDHFNICSDKSVDKTKYAQESSKNVSFEGDKVSACFWQSAAGEERPGTPDCFWE